MKNEFYEYSFATSHDVKRCNIPLRLDHIRSWFDLAMSNCSSLRYLLIVGVVRGRLSSASIVCRHLDVGEGSIDLAAGDGRSDVGRDVDASDGQLYDVLPVSGSMEIKVTIYATTLQLRRKNTSYHNMVLKIEDKCLDRPRIQKLNSSGEDYQKYKNSIGIY